LKWTVRDCKTVLSLLSMSSYYRILAGYQVLMESCITSTVRLGEMALVYVDNHYSLLQSIKNFILYNLPQIV